MESNDYLLELKNWEPQMGRPELCYRAKAGGASWNEIKEVCSNPIQICKVWAESKGLPWPVPDGYDVPDFGVSVRGGVRRASGIGVVDDAVNEVVSDELKKYFRELGSRFDALEERLGRVVLSDDATDISVGPAAGVGPVIVYDPKLDEIPQHPGNVSREEVCDVVRSSPVEEHFEKFSPPLEHDVAPSVPDGPEIVEGGQYGLPKRYFGDDRIQWLCKCLKVVEADVGEIEHPDLMVKEFDRYDVEVSKKEAEKALLKGGSDD